MTSSRASRPCNASFTNLRMKSELSGQPAQVIRQHPQGICRLGYAGLRFRVLLHNVLNNLDIASNIIHRDTLFPE
jgi:hypothetical protein